MLMHDAELLGLLRDRERLLMKLAPVIARVGSNHPKRSAENKRRATLRQTLRTDLMLNAEAIAARCMALRNTSRVSMPLNDSLSSSLPTSRAD